MIFRHCVKCTICGTKTITRTAPNSGSYLEFAFPCPGCSIEIRFGLNLIPPSAAPAKLINAEWADSEDGAVRIESFDADHLIPVCGDKGFSPYLATVSALEPQNRLQFFEHQQLRLAMIEEIWPKIDQLIIHFNRGQWDFFDRQFLELQYDDVVGFSSILQRRLALNRALEQYGTFFFTILDESQSNIVKERLALANATSPLATKDLARYFLDRQKDIDIDSQIFSIRRQWVKIYLIIAPIYTMFYWDKSQNQPIEYTLAQKRFDELKSLYVDCFETFCRLSVIAAGIEGIIRLKSAVVPKSTGTMTLEQFDLMKSGVKPDILKNLSIANLFVPFIDHKLRNGIGHHSAHYDVLKDSVEYSIENEKGIQNFSIPYIEFCERLVRLYGQVELVSRYSNWLRIFSA